jgi:hypothetical protein
LPDVPGGKEAAEMVREGSGRQVKSVDIGGGLFLVRYGSAEDPFEPPKVTVSVARDHIRNIEFILTPDAREPVLWQPGTALVVRAIAQATLLIEATPLRQDGSRTANVKVERLSQGEPAAISSIPAPAVEKLDLSRLRLVGHVAGIGDVAVGPNEWIAGPSAPSRIEGIGVEWPGKPTHLNLRYSVSVARPQPIAGPMQEVGSFAGTRRQALPLIGVVFELSGPASSDHRLLVEGSFLGSPTMRAVGNRVALSGPTGREPLIGLRLNIESINSPATLAKIAPARTMDTAVSPSAPSSATKPKQKSSSRVRVFRSRSKDDQPSK